jgi:Rad3-related DNA helicase
MGLGLAFAELRQRLRELDELVEQLQTVAEQDRPAEGDCLAADEVADAARDLRGLLAEALNGATMGSQALRHRDLGRAAAALSSCHQRVADLFERFWQDLASSHRIETLRGLGRERGAAWTGWTAQVEKSLEHGWHRLLAVNRAVLACWRDIAELVELALVARQGAGPGPVSTKAGGGLE